MSAIRWRRRAAGRRPTGRGRPSVAQRRRGTVAPARHLRLPAWRPGPRVVLAFIAAVLLLGGGFLWLRTSSLVAVTRVSITGVSGPEAGRITAALRRVARTMTTLDVNLGALNTAVAPYPVVKRLRVSTQFPHGMRIVVDEQLPVAVISAGGETAAVASDGTLLHNAVGIGALPVLATHTFPGGTRVSDPATLQLVALLAAAPWQLRARLTQVQLVSGRGIVANLRSGPELIFGDSTQLAAKWAAVSAVLASPDSAGAQYIDVTVPTRAAAGADLTTSTTSATGTAATTAGTTSTASATGSAPTSGPAATTGAAAATGAAGTATTLSGG